MREVLRSAGNQVVASMARVVDTDVVNDDDTNKCERSASNGEGSTRCPTNPSVDSSGGSESVAPKASDIFMLVRQQNFQVALQLLTAFPAHWTAHDEEGYAMLHWGALVGNKDFVKCCLSKGCPVDVEANNGQTPLMWAVLRGHTPVARMLLDAGAGIRKKDSLGATPLIIAVQHLKHKSILLLMNKGKDKLLSDCDTNGCTAAHWAAYKGDLVSLRLLNYFDADSDALDNLKMTPLHRAVSASQMGAVEFLVKQSADPRLRNSEGKNCLEIAEGQENKRMESLLVSLMKKMDFPSDDKSGDDLEAGKVAYAKDGAVKKESMLKTLFKDKAAQKLFPVFWIVCVSLALFQYITDLRVTGYQVAPIMSILFELGVPGSLLIFAWVALADPGKVPSRIKGNSGVEELMRNIDSDTPEDQQVDVSRLCTTTWVLKGLRTKYCVNTGACVEEFDHYCIWLNTAIGKRNHRQFIGLSIAEAITQACHLYLCWSVSLELVPYQTFWTWLCSVIFGYPLLFIIAFLHCLTMPWIFLLTFQHLRMIGSNITTNEMMNVQRYEHFWVSMPGQPRRFVNPFNKGGFLRNQLDFWWLRKRSQVNQKPQCCGTGCGHGHNLGHGHAH